ncbi:endonuclease III [Ruminococcaceae bacterium OttesenSCG-928-A16]|nr:endonuclease III [Ruminococcaceae bacterium OttesenSCG-928-A16]
MRTKADAKKIVEALKAEYPVGICSLDYDNAWQLMVAVRLSAQCTDARVNVVTEILFKKYPTLEALASATPAEIEEIVRPCGLGRSKARDISAATGIVLTQYGGHLPNTMEELLKLPGVGRKSANLILGDIFHVPGVVIADTHCIRMANRLGFIKSTDPLKVENALRKALPPEESNDYCHRCVLHGRAVCTARKAFCGKCVLQNLCPKIGVTPAE